MTETPVITTMQTTEVTVNCPHCFTEQGGFMRNPAGHDIVCSECEKSFHIHPDADIEINL